MPELTPEPGRPSFMIRVDRPVVELLTAALRFAAEHDPLAPSERLIQHADHIEVGMLEAELAAA